MENNPDPDGPDYDFPEGKINFSHPPVPLDQVYFIEPMGFLDVLPESHIGVHHKDILNPPTTIPIYAVEDGLILEWGHYFGD